MFELPITSITSQRILQQRWERSLAMFEMWTQIWKDNPKVLARSSKKARELMMPLEQLRRLQAAKVAY